jgi:hypothetical protein
VWEMDTAGNQPFSGEWEFVPSPGATFRQIGCDLAPGGRVGRGGGGGRGGAQGMSAISYAYETTTRGVQPVEVEQQILGGLRATVAASM